MNRKSFFSGLALAVMVGAIVLAMFGKLSGIVGIDMPFSFSHCLLPLLGAVFGLSGCCTLFLALFTVRSMLGVLPYAYFGLPTFCASLGWTRYHRIVNVFIPLVSILLFVMHPIGGQAATYACYWFIPLLIALLKLENRFFTALSSTFLAHAVGSVMHLYIINPMSPEAWIQLIPAVALERFIIAAGMYVVITSAHLLLNYVSRVAFKDNYKRSESVLF